MATRDLAPSAKLSGARIRREADRLLRAGRITTAEHLRYTSMTLGVW